MLTGLIYDVRLRLAHEVPYVGVRVLQMGLECFANVVASCVLDNVVYKLCTPASFGVTLEIAATRLVTLAIRVSFDTMAAASLCAVKNPDDLIAICTLGARLLKKLIVR